MNLAWNELSQEIVGGDIKLKSQDEKVLSMVESFNNAPFSKEDLGKDSYYVKSGYGKETVNQINKESKAKFPEKSFSDLDLDLGQRDIISYAYFLKEVEYPVEFEKMSVDFLGETVKGFKAKNKKQKENVVLLDYTDDDKFIVRLELKEDLDHLSLSQPVFKKTRGEI
ncbi:MAG: hypothetical protein GF335_04395 [Candidatus Moranbacteria bacterium]|nr:hypothetical protein [Candidatus Moranbacteria bacterium]